MSALPIDAVLGDIHAALARANRLVLAAPPGAGKTTRVPLDLLSAQWRGDGRLILLEPRRIAARMAAERMAATLGERVGETVGLRTRLDTRVSKATRLEIVTEGVFTRMILADPALEGVAGVLFDEIHERALSADLGLALAMETQGVLREELRLVLMSATLDTEKFRARTGAELIVSEGRAFPVETVYLGRDRDERVEDGMARAIRRALRENAGSVLAFLPGQGEILRTLERLSDLPDDVDAVALYGALAPAEQDRAVRPAPPGRRKVVIATDIAESALTIEGVTVVIDAGLARVPETDAASGLTRLVTRRAARANIDQRRGRAGRTAPGVCYRLWEEGETRGLPAEPTPEILTADLSALVLDLARWGERDPGRLTWLDPPPPGRVKAAQAALREMGALDADGGVTALGGVLAQLPLPPRLGLLVATPDTPARRALGAQLAVLVSERGAGGTSCDIATRLSRLNAAGGGLDARARDLARAWGGGAKPALASEAAGLIAAAWPGRIARARDRETAPGLYLMASGEACRIEPTDPLARQDWLVILDVAGAAREGRIALAAPLPEADALKRVETVEITHFDAGSRAISAKRVRRIGAITLSETPLPAPKGEAVARALLQAVREQGLALLPAWPGVAETLARIGLLRRTLGEPWPDWDAASLLDRVEEWLLPLLASGRLEAVREGDARQAIAALLPWPLPRELDALAPRRFEAPTGASHAIDYTGDNAPLVALRVQEVYGLATHPAIAGGRVALTLSLLSPAHRPVALTRDLPGFWAGGYHDMRKDMRGRYPKHDWPEDPASARAHAGRTKNRLSS